METSARNASVEDSPGVAKVATISQVVQTVNVREFVAAAQPKWAFLLISNEPPRGGCARVIDEVRA